MVLYQLGQFDDVWPLAEKIGTDPTVRNLVIHGIWNRGSSAITLLEKLCSETSDSILQFAMLAIGEFPITAFDESELDRLVSRVADLLNESRTAQIAASAQWLLRRIGRDQICEALVQNETNTRQEQRQAEIEQLQEILEGTSEPATLLETWYQKNTKTPRDIGLLKPNQWGLFDMHGNAMEWCIDLHEPFARFEDGAQDFPRCDGAVTTKNRELRGGAYYDLPIYIRSANRYSQPPEGHLASTGMRICRTLKNLDSPAADPGNENGE